MVFDKLRKAVRKLARSVASKVAGVDEASAEAAVEVQSQSTSAASVQAVGGVVAQPQPKPSGEVRSGEVEGGEGKRGGILRRAVSAVTGKVLTREISEEDLEPILEELLMDLVESDVAFEAAEAIVEGLKSRLVGKKIPRFSKVEEHVIKAFRETVESILAEGYKPIDLVEAARRKQGEPLKIVFFGVNGVGKTTTIAKIAYMFKKAGITPVICAADTYRAGAQEQLRKHAERLGVPFIGGRYGADPAAVAYDAIEYAKARGYKVVLIDTAGRMHTDPNLMEELRKLVKVVKPDFKILVVDSLTGNDALEQAKFFEEAVGIDYIILTKVDADVKGGTAISLVHAVGKPILFIGTGQRYEDLEPFEPRRFAAKLLGEESSG